MATRRTGGARILKNKFPELYKKLHEACDDQIKEAADNVAKTIKPNLWDKRIPVRVRRSGPLQYEVAVGSRRFFFSGFAEFGTVDQPAKPVVTPAAEQEREAFTRGFIQAFQRATGG